MLQPDFDPAPTEVRIHWCRYVSPCKARGCMKRATLIAEKTDAAGRHVRQIELCPPHCEIVIERERARGLGDLRQTRRIAYELHAARLRVRFSIAIPVGVAPLVNHSSNCALLHNIFRPILRNGANWPFAMRH